MASDLDSGHGFFSLEATSVRRAGHQKFSQSICFPSPLLASVSISYSMQNDHVVHFPVKYTIPHIVPYPFKSKVSELIGINVILLLIKNKFISAAQYELLHNACSPMIHLTVTPSYVYDRVMIHTQK